MNANVLVTAAGSIVAQGIIKSLKLANANKNSPVHYKIIATDISAQAAGLYRSDHGVLIPPVNSPKFVDSIVEICHRYDIHAVFVGSDDELLKIGENKKLLESETGAKILTSPQDVLVIARDKWKSSEFLKLKGIPTPKTCLPEDSEKLVREFGYPLVVKPREGYGSLHFYIASSKEDLENAISVIQKSGWHPIVQEYLQEENEFTSGVTVDRSGKYIMSSISMRRVIKNGQTYKAFIDNYYEIRKSAEELSLKIGAIGSVNIQAKLDEGIPKIIEINPRFSASCPLRSVAGINEPDIVFRNSVLGEEIKKESYQKLVCFRYLNEVYMPYSVYESACRQKEINGTDSYIVDYF